MYWCGSSETESALVQAPPACTLSAPADPLFVTFNIYPSASQMAIAPYGAARGDTKSGYGFQPDPTSTFYLQHIAW